MGRPIGQLERSLAALTIGVHQGREQRQRTLADTGSGVYRQMVHLDISGQAGTAWASVQADVQWEFPILYAPLQCRLPFSTPHFQPGIEMVAAGDLVLLHANVRRWNVSPEGWYTGATVEVACQAPNAGAVTVPFSAIAHLSFDGFASYAESGDFQ